MHSVPEYAPPSTQSDPSTSPTAIAIIMMARASKTKDTALESLSIAINALDESTRPGDQRLAHHLAVRWLMQQVEGGS